MNQLRYLVVCVIALLFALTACTSSTTSTSPDPVSVGCAVEQSISGAFATSISSAVPCDNGGAIQSDILAALGKVNLCAKKDPATGGVKAQGILGDVVCPIAVNSALGVLGSKLPASWGCHPGTGSAINYSDMLKAACSKAIGI